MADLTREELATKLRGERFKPSGPDVAKLSDPIADTSMVVTLDELRPYDLNPRIVRNPRYDDIKASIRERGLEHPPPITRRPNEPHYIIRNGGNTRLSILNELWKETKDERFFRIQCLFRPWSARGEILVLTGHLAENELRGALTFIERALGVDKARVLYEQEAGDTLTQTELSKRLKQDGYPVTQSHISRMQDAIRYLLPSMPKILYGGLGKHQVERLITLRRAAQRMCERHATKKSRAVDFDALFHDVCASFDLAPATFNVQRLQDELIGQMANLLEADYDALTLELVDAEAWNQSWLREPAAPSETSPMATTVTPPGRAAVELASPASMPVVMAEKPAPLQQPRVAEDRRESNASPAPIRSVPSDAQDDDVRKPDDGSARVVSTGAMTERVRAIQKQLTQAAEEPQSQKREPGAPRPLSEKAPTPESAADIWNIDPSIDEPPSLRQHIGQLACRIAEEAAVASCVELIDSGIGFVCHTRPAVANSQDAAQTGDVVRVRAIVSLLACLSSGYGARRSGVDGVRLLDDLAPLLQGTFPPQRTYSASMRLSDDALLKLFRLIRLARRLVDFESAAAGTANLYTEHH